MKVKIKQGIVTLTLQDGRKLTRTFDGRSMISYDYKGWFGNRHKEYITDPEMGIFAPRTTAGIEYAKAWLRELDLSRLIEMDSNFLFLKSSDIKSFDVAEGEEVEIEREEFELNV